MVLLSGEAGVGKSRLTAALLEHLATEPHTRLRNFCSPQHTDSALHPTIGQMERAAAFTHDDLPQAKLNKLEALLVQTSTSTHDAALIAEVLSLTNDGRYPVLELTPQQRRQKTLEALVLQVVILSRQNPLLMILEDAHWMDPTSLELFGRIVDSIPSLRVLLMVTFRPEFQAPWIGRPYVTALTINRLAEHDVGAIIDRVVGNKLLNGPPGTFCTTDHDALLKTPVVMTIDAEQIFEKAHSISAHGFNSGCYRLLPSHRRQWVGLSGMGRLARTSRHPEPSRRRGTLTHDIRRCRRS